MRYLHHFAVCTSIDNEKRMKKARKKPLGLKRIPIRNMAKFTQAIFSAQMNF